MIDTESGKAKHFYIKSLKLQIEDYALVESAFDCALIKDWELLTEMHFKYIDEELMRDFAISEGLRDYRFEQGDLKYVLVLNKTGISDFTVAHCEFFARLAVNNLEYLRFNLAEVNQDEIHTLDEIVNNLAGSTRIEFGCQEEISHTLYPPIFQSLASCNLVHCSFGLDSPLKLNKSQGLVLKNALYSMEKLDIFELKGDYLEDKSIVFEKIDGKVRDKIYKILTK